MNPGIRTRAVPRSGVSAAPFIWLVEREHRVVVQVFKDDDAIHLSLL